MRRYSRQFLWLIILLTIVVIVINIPRTIPISFDSKIPLINKKISVHKDLPGFNPNFTLGSLHIQKDTSFHRGLDLQGGTSVTLQANMKDIPQDKRDDALNSTKLVIENRVNLFGVSEPIVQTAHVNND